MAVQRFENNVTLQVDSHIMRKQLPENSAALNVHFGTFLGGVGDFTAEFLNDVIGFRGCISDVSEEWQRLCSCKAYPSTLLPFLGLLQQHQHYQARQGSYRSHHQHGSLLELQQ